MRELTDFSTWADAVIQESLQEKAQAPVKREIPTSQDVMYQATRKYRDLSPGQALSRFLADKLEDFDRRDLDQNKVINRQRQENEKLRGQVTQISQELQDIEAHSAEADKELERIKQLGGKLQTDVETRRVGSREVEEIMAQVQALRNKPGVDPETYEKLKTEVEGQIKELRTQGIDPGKFQEFKDQLNKISASQQVDTEQLKNLERLVGQAQASGERLGSKAQEQVETINQLIKDLEEKEERFDKSIRKSEVKYKKYEQELENQAKANAAQNDAIERIKVTDQIQDDALQELKSDYEPHAIAAPTSNLYGLQTDLDKMLAARRAAVPVDEPEMSTQGQLAATTPTPTVSRPAASPEQEMPQQTEPTQIQQPQGMTASPQDQDDLQDQDKEKSSLKESDERTRENTRIAVHYAKEFAKVFYAEFVRDPNKRHIIRRYAYEDALDALFQSAYHWLMVGGRYGLEDERRIWKTALEILVAQHPYIEHDDLGLDPRKIKGLVARPPYVSTARVTPQTPAPDAPPSPQAELPFGNTNGNLKESRLPRKYTQAIEDMAAQILGDQYSKYLR